MVTALHLAALSFALGPRCIPYTATAYLTAVAVWGGSLMSMRKRRVCVLVGLALSLTIQQAAYQVWKTELAGSWWPFVQFGAVQLLIAVLFAEAMKQAGRSANLRDR